jgi:hypothetical protein
MVIGFGRNRRFSVCLSGTLLQRQRDKKGNLLWLSLFQKISFAGDEGVQHPEGLLGRDGVALETGQPPAPSIIKLF